MIKKFIVNTHKLILILILSINSTNAMQNYNNFPKSIQILYTSSFGIKVTMNFKLTGNNYYINTNLNIPLYQIKYISNGSITDNGTLKFINFQDIRNNKNYSMAKIYNQTNQIHYGKINSPIIENIQYHIYDPFSFAWQFTFNQNVFTNNIKITNGKRLYDMQTLSAGEIKNFTIDHNIIYNKQNNPLRLINVQLKNIKNSNNNFNFSLAKDFYLIPIITSFNIKNKTYNLNINKIIIDDKIVWNYN